MIKFSDHKIFLQGISMAVLIFIVIFYFSYRVTNYANYTASWVSHTQEVLFHTEKLLLTATGVETGARAFLLTGQQQFRETLESSEKAVRVEIKTLKQLTSDNAVQQVRMDSLTSVITRRSEYADSIVRLKKQVDMRSALDIVNQGGDKSYTDSIIQLVEKMQQEERRLLVLRTNNNQVAVARQRELFIYAVFGMLGILIYIFWKEKKYAIKKEKEKSEIMFGDLLESAPDAMIIISENGKIAFTNRQAELLFKYEKNELTGLVAEALMPDDLPIEYWKVSELTAIKKNGLQFPVEVNVSPLKTPEGILLSACVRDITERRQPAEMLKKSEELFRLLVTSIKDYAIFMIDTNGLVTSWNSGAEHIKGYTADEIVGHSIALFYTAEDRKNDEPNFNLRTAREQGSYEKEGWRVRKDGSLFIANVIITALYDDAGNLKGYSKVTRDITEKRKAEERILFLASIANNIQDPVISTSNLTDNNNFVITRWNKSAERLLEWKSEEVIGKSAGEIFQTTFPHEDRDHIFELLEAKGFWQGEVIYHTKSGRPVYVLSTISYLKDAAGNITGYLVLIRDITKRKKAEEQLKEFEHFFNNSNDLSCIANKEGYFEIINPSFKKLLGYSKSELSGKPFINFVHPDDIASTLHEYEKLKSGATVIHFFNRYRKKDGTYLLFDWNASPNAATGKLYCIARDITDRKKAEDALGKLNEELEQRVKERTGELAKSEKRFRKLIENNYDIISLMDESFKIIYRSPSASRITGWADEDMKNATGTANIHPDDLGKVKEIIQELMLNPFKPVDASFRNLHKNGHYLWIEGTLVNLLQDEDVNAIVFNFRDVTKRKELENLLSKANTLAKIGGWEVDLIKGTVYWTDITREIHETAYGYVPDLESGINFFKEGQERDLIAQKVNDAIEFGKPWDVELQIVTAKNNECWVRCIGETELVNGKCVRIYGSFQDINLRKIAEEKLIKSEGLYRNLFTNMINGFSYCQAIFEDGRLNDYTYLAVNNEYEKLTGLKDLTGKKMSDVMPELLNSDPAYAEIVKSVAINGHSQKFETYVQPLDKWFSVSLYSPGKGYFVSLVDNITERKMAEQKIKKLNIELEERVLVRTGQLRKTNEEMEAFSYSVSHDLRSPLRAIIGFAGILEEEYGSKLDKEGWRLTSVIRRNAAKMGQLIDDLLNFSRLGRQDITKGIVDTADLVREAIAEINPLFNVSQFRWLINNLADSFADRNTIKQVWLNLIANAVKYSGKATHPQIEIGSYLLNDQTVFFVKDNGAGFDDKYKHKLFKVFQRLHSNDEFEGTGVGLAIVEKIVSKHGGSVWAEAVKNKGATFYFSLPAIAPAGN